MRRWHLGRCGPQGKWRCRWFILKLSKVHTHTRETSRVNSVLILHVTHLHLARVVLHSLDLENKTPRAKILACVYECVCVGGGEGVVVSMTVTEILQFCFLRYELFVIIVVVDFRLWCLNVGFLFSALNYILILKVRT